MEDGPWTASTVASKFVDMNSSGTDVLLDIVEALRGHDIPRLGWPTSVLPPRGVHVTAYERPSTVTIVVSKGRSEGTARLDLETREVAVSATARSEQHRSRLRRLALAYVADRNDFDERSGIDVRPNPPLFDEQDADTWTPMQLVADVTGADWYPPTPQERSPAAWAAFYATAHRFNDRFMAPDVEATTLRPTPPRGGQLSANPATPDPGAPAGE